MRQFVRVTGTILVILLSACAPARDASTPQARAALFDEFRRGETVLNCTVACIRAWIRAREQMQALDAAREWQALAVLVASTGYMRDLGYYYLGRAADGLDLREAARRYYRNAYALATGSLSGPKCREVAGDCNGVDLLAVLPALAEGRRNAPQGGPLPRPPQNLNAGGPPMGPWIRLACNDGRRLAIRFPVGGDREAETAQVMVDRSTKIETYENTHGASGIHYLGPPGYWISQWHGQWSYNHDVNGKPTEVECHEVK